MNDAEKKAYLQQLYNSKQEALGELKYWSSRVNQFQDEIDKIEEELGI